MKTGKGALQEIGWNGISFTAPAHWEISRIGTRYLYLENDAGPVMEVKWEPVRGRFSLRKQLRRLATLQRHRSGKTFRECSLPSGWAELLTGVDARCFSWEGRPFGGIGLVVYCPECRNATLIQFFRKNAAGPDDLSRRILASFRDHPTEDHVFWSVFDIRVVTPASFKLLKYRFDAGAFVLQFDTGGQQVTLYRWGPAAVLLRNRSLDAFAGTVIRLPPVDSESFSISGSNGLQWRSIPAKSPPAGWLNRILPGHRFHWVRIWHVAVKNRILGIKLEGKKPIASNLIDSLSSSYESI